MSKSSSLRGNKFDAFQRELEKRDRRFTNSSKALASSVSIEHDDNGSFVNKRFYSRFKSELLKHQIIEAALSGTDTCFPKAISSDGSAEQGVLKLEFIDNFVSSRHFYLLYAAGAIDDVNLFEKAGNALARIHAAKKPDAGAGKNLSDNAILETLEGIEPQDFVLLHGDFGFSNVGYSSSRNQVVILDPSPNYFVTSHPLQMGPRYVDIAQFTSCLCGLVGFGDLWRIKWNRVPRTIEAFVSGYERTSGFRIDRKLLLESTLEFANAYIAYSMNSRIMRRLARAWFASRIRRIERHYE
jgi:hypothetical protein